MKKSKQVPATLVATVAALMSVGCSRPGVTEVRRCIDDQGRVMPDSMCTGSSGYGGGGYSGGYYRSSHWVYGGSFSNGSVSRYHSSPSLGASVSDSSGHTISRGGFGS